MLATLREHYATPLILQVGAIPRKKNGLVQSHVSSYWWGPVQWRVSDIRLPGFKSCSRHLLAVWPWAGYLTSPSFHFPDCKTRMRIRKMQMGVRQG